MIMCCLEPISKLLRFADTALNGFKKWVQNTHLLLCKLRFFTHSCLVSPALADFEIGSSFGISVYCQLPLPAHMFSEPLAYNFLNHLCAFHVKDV
jgi:hypothetical protein